MPPARRIFPLEEPPPPPPAPVPPSTSRRDAQLVTGLTVLGAGAALGVLATLVDLVTLSGSARSGLVTVSVTLTLLTDLALVGAWVAAVRAFRTRVTEERTRQLVYAAALVATSAGVEILALAFSAVATVDDELPGTALASDLVGLTGAIILLAVAAAAGAAFAGPRDRRDGRLAWAAIGFGVVSALAMIGGGLLAIAFGELGYSDKLATGIWLTGIGSVFAVGGAALAGAGLLNPARRSVLFPSALLLWGVTNLVACIGGLVSASAMRANGYETLDIVGVRVAALAALVTAGGAVALAGAFRRDADPPRY